MVAQGLHGKKIMFVCTGNTCRSAMAAALARRALEELLPAGAEIQITSAGLAALPGDGASPGASKVLRERGIDLSGHRASPLSPQDIEKADLVLAMTTAHRDILCRLVPSRANRIHTLAEYGGAAGDVSDPYGQGDGVYRRVADQLELLVYNALRRYVREYCDEPPCSGGKS